MLNCSTASCRVGSTGLSGARRRRRRSSLRASFVPDFVLVKLLARSLGGKTRRSPLLGPSTARSAAASARSRPARRDPVLPPRQPRHDMVYGRIRPARVDDLRGPSRCSTPRSGRSSTGSRRGACRSGSDGSASTTRWLREKRAFVPPIRSGSRSMSAAHVYGRAHSQRAAGGGVRHAVRLLRHEYGEDHVVYARNVTAVDDKIIAAAAEEGVAPSAIAERYEPSTRRQARARRSRSRQSRPRDRGNRPDDRDDRESDRPRQRL